MPYITDLKNIKNWNDFQFKLKKFSNKERGDAFEFVTKQYLLTDPVYQTQLAHVWLLTEVPQKIRQKLQLPDTDQGIDIVAETRTGEYWAIQCKYRTSDSSNLTWREISTFTGLTFGICKHFTYGLIAYTGERYTKVLDQSEHIGFLSSDVWSQLDDTFFSSFAEAKTGKLKAYSPRPHQARAIKNAVEYFKNKSHTRGKLIMPCGAGKSLTGFWIAEALKAKTIVVAVPSLSLIQQTLPVWLREFAARDKSEKLSWLCVCSDQTVTSEADSIQVHTQDLGYPCMTNVADIVNWLHTTVSSPVRVIFTTYQSGEVFAEAARLAKFEADLIIMDEAHKTVGQKHKLFSHLLFDENLLAKRRIFMTATERRYAGSGDEIISMDDPKVYGETFDLLTFKDALEQKPPILSDYKVITMVIAEDEVQKLVTSNQYITPTGKDWAQEVEAQMFASMIALRKAMQKYPIKHAVSFHSSIARARAFQALNDTFSNNTNDQLETFHVTGNTPTAVRKQTINEFAKSPRSLITNARCLTEGVDVPNIDGVLFTDPKKSTIDIVQAIGRALRPSKGKEFGYVIVPVVAKNSDSESFIASDAFKQIMSLLRSLASNDERIIEYFRVISTGRKIDGKIIEIDIDEKIALQINIADFARNIETRVWEHIAKLTWRSYMEAREFVRSLHLKSREEWKRYCMNEYAHLPQKPFDIPSSPEVYGEEYRINGGSVGWLGFGRRRQYGWKSYDEAAKFVHTLKLKSFAEWTKYCKDELNSVPKRPDDIPRDPAAYYGDEFHRNGGMGGWLGTGTVAMRYRKYRSYESARDFAVKLGLKNKLEWNAYCQGALKKLVKKPQDIPSDPQYRYGEEFKINGGWGGWLGHGIKKGGWRSFEEATKFVHSLNLKSTDEWNDYCLGKRPDLPERPIDIPISFRAIYKQELGDGGSRAWLGSALRRRGIDAWLQYSEAKQVIQKFKIKDSVEWGKFSKSEMKPDNVPATPKQVYKAEWISWSDWLGKNNS